MKNYKDTLNMPYTDFSMRAKLITKEPFYREKWLKDKLYEKLLERNSKNKQYILHDGPPYANGELHCGHALNKILKDIIVRYKTMQGFYSPYIPGWDTHGLPIENKMLKTFSKSHNDFSILELRKKAEEYAISQVNNQKEDFKKMQLLSDLKKFYITLDPKFEASQLRLFHAFVKQNLVFKTLKPVYWSPSSESALAEAEIEYKMHVSPSVVVSVDLTGETKNIPEDTKLIIWTTTPWTLLANSGIAIGKKIEYQLIQVQDKKYVIASDRIEEISKDCKWKEVKKLQTLTAEELVGIEYIRPFGTKKGKVIYGHHVTTESGTGLVHMAPLFGEDDFVLGKKENLDQIMHVDDKGNITKSIFEKVNGMFYMNANKEIGMDLEKRNKLLALKFIKHRFPFDWRTKKPIMYRATDQWFVSIKKIQGKILKSLEKVKFYSSWAHKRLSNMISGRDDWCISRQRAWGVPIIIFYDKDKNPVFNDDIFEHVISLVEKNGSNIWYEKTTDELLPKKYRGKLFSKENDIMDVWFDSGSSSILDLGDKVIGPYDLYLEGSDQYRGWFNSSLISSVCYRGESPYRNLVSHGFVLDGKGNKMSKSLGNVISPLKIIKTKGADILRLWVANSEYQNDIAMTNEIINQNVEYYRRIRNTFKFMLGNIQDFDFSTQKVPLKGYHLAIDEKIKKLYNKIIKNYDNFEFMKIIKQINEFFVELSSFYFDIAKDVLYVEKIDNLQRRMFQTNIYQIIDLILIALAPIIPTTAEDIYDHFNKKNKLSSVHLEQFKKPFNIETNYEEKWKPFFKLKDQVYKKLEEAKKNKIINRNNEAIVTLNTDDIFLNINQIKRLLMLGKVVEGKEIKIEKFDSKKCQRCWNHYDITDMHEDICNRCFKIIN